MLETLSAQYPLPSSMSGLETFVDVIEVGDVRIHACGLSAAHLQAGILTGAAAALDEVPYPRSYFELLERAAILDFVTHASNENSPYQLSDNQRLSHSNGTALERDERRARQAALSELIERDRVLRSFYGQTRPEPVRPASGPLPESLSDHFDLSAYVFPPPSNGVELPAELGGPATVAGVFGFPRERNAPLLIGFGARPSAEEALAAAAREALQQLAFGWGEPTPEREPDPTPTPEFHLDFYGFSPNHALLRSWLSGAHFGAGPNLPAPHGAPLFRDITPAELVGKLCVVKAAHTGALPLAFGLGHPLLDDLPPSMRVQPIP